MDRPKLSDIPAEARQRIDRSLTEIEHEHQVRLVFAIESGSRAWGFPSPDSDYDVRFVYVHRPDWYLSVQARRDVIELPFDGVYDINGWDIRKTLGLACKHNPVLSEWLAAPIVYRSRPGLTAALRAFVGRSDGRATAVHHYYGLGIGAFSRDIDGRADISLKKYFYSLRPALALRWLRLRQPFPPPMDLPALIERIELSAAERQEIARLVVLKSSTREMGQGQSIPLLDTLIREELTAAKKAIAAGLKPPGADEDQADALLRETVREIWRD